MYELFTYKHIEKYDNLCNYVDCILTKDLDVIQRGYRYNLYNPVTLTKGMHFRQIFYEYKRPDVLIFDNGLVDDDLVYISFINK